MPLLVHRDEMIAVVENERLDQPAKIALQVLCIVDAGDVVLARLDHQRPLLDVRQFRLQRIGEAPQLAQGMRRGAENAGKASSRPEVMACRMILRTRSSLMP